MNHNNMTQYIITMNIFSPVAFFKDVWVLCLNYVIQMYMQIVMCFFLLHSDSCMWTLVFCPHHTILFGFRMVSFHFGHDEYRNNWHNPFLLCITIIQWVSASVLISESDININNVIFFPNTHTQTHSGLQQQLSTYSTNRKRASKQTQK